jgi:hypothetical protein
MHWDSRLDEGSDQQVTGHLGSKVGGSCRTNRIVYGLAGPQSNQIFTRLCIRWCWEAGQLIFWEDEGSSRRWQCEAG